MAKERKAPEGIATMRPSEMPEGGGLLDNIVAMIVEDESRYVNTNYGGRSSMTRPAAHHILQEVDPKTFQSLGDEFRHDDQYWSCGKAAEWTPTDDGTPADEGVYLLPLGNNKEIHINSNYGMFLNSLIEAGFPEDRIDPAADSLGGLVVELHQQDTGRPAKEKDGKTFPDTVLCATKILRYPWDPMPKGSGGKKGTAAKGKTAAANSNKKGATKGKAADTGSDDATDTNSDLMMEVEIAVLGFLENAGEDGIQKKDLARQIMAYGKENKKAMPDVKEMLNIVQDDGFLGDPDRTWEYENGILTM